MILVDYVAIGSFVLFGIVGAFIGFGKGLQVLTKGVFGIIISVVATYFLLDILLGISFVQDFMLKIKEFLSVQENAFCEFLVTIKFEHIVVAILLFVIMQILRKVVILIVSRMLESDNAVVKVVNKTLGAALSVTLMVGLSLLVMQIVYFSSGTQASSWFEGSFFRLDYLYIHNPLASLFN